MMIGKENKIDISYTNMGRVKKSNFMLKMETSKVTLNVKVF